MGSLRITQQLSDFLAYVLIPGLAVILPAATSRRIMARASRWHWFMSAAAGSAFEGASVIVEIDDEASWKKRWKQVELLEVRDLYMMLCGRSRSVLAEVEFMAPAETAKDRVIIGMHWGPSISILKLLQVAKLDPALPYRPPEKQVLRIRPFYYLFSTMAARYMVKTMGNRAIAVGGAGKRLRAMMDQPGSVIVVMDAPPMEGRPTVTAPVLGQSAVFNAGFPEILVKRQKEYVFYAISLQEGDSVLKKLEMEGPFTSDSVEGFLRKYAEFLGRHVASDPSQWRIWHVARQFWVDQD